MSNTSYANPALGGAPEPTPPPPLPTRRRGLVLPSVLVVGGLLALALNLGIVHWETLARLGPYWPLLLVFIGAELFIRGRVSGISAILAALLVLGLLASAMGTAGSDLFAATGPQVTTTSSAVIGDLTSSRLVVDGSALNMTIRAAPLGDDLYRATSVTPGNERATVSLDRARGSLTIDLGHGHPFFDNGGARRTLDLQLSDRVSWLIALDTAAAEGDLDLTSAHLAGLDVNSGASHYSVKLPAPTARVPVRVSGGAMSLDLVIPRGAAMKVDTTGGPNSITAGGLAQGGIGGGHWMSAGYSSSGPRYDVAVNGGANSVSVTEVDGAG